VRAAIDALARAGASLVEVEIPFAAQIMAVEFGLCLPEASAYYREMLRERADLYQQDVRTFLQAGELIPATDYITALRVRQKMKQAWAAMFAGIDVPIGPAVAAPATRRDQDSVRWPDGTMEPVTPVFVRLSAPANVTGLLSVAVPCGFTDDRLPVAFQVIGRPFDESTILKVARSYEALTDWTSQAPPI
jgi:aspartyl-tRNA(Asn)/glutamyl-tRNA(Gln) amidotransferase subunit A